MTEVKTFKEIEILIKNAENAFCKEKIKAKKKSRPEHYLKSAY